MNAVPFDYPVYEFCWYGMVSILSLLCFTSLTFEVQRAGRAALLLGNEQAAMVVRATYNVNFLAMLAANAALIACCIGIAAAEVWQPYFGGSIMVCASYWLYTRACEKKLIHFLVKAGVYDRQTGKSQD